ncbi:MAG: hypothetical protein IT285_08520 [Bdellovibrionales bacterium]|nr:hypothetical protein [Bdellovibrionales bacterium]
MAAAHRDPRPTRGALPIPVTIPDAAARTGYHHEWYFKLNDPSRRQALLIRFTVLASRNGFRRSAEVSAVFWRKLESGEVEKSAVKRGSDLEELIASPDQARLGDCEFSGSRLRGAAQSKGSAISWDFALKTAGGQSFDFVSENLARSGLVRNRAVTCEELLLFTGSYSVDGRSFQVEAVPGMWGAISGPTHAHSWIWGHCNHFRDAEGAPSDLIFDGLTARARLPGGLRSPRLSAMYFHYRGQPHEFNGLLDSIRIRSSQSLTEWRFQADRGDLSFRGHFRASLKDFAGLSIEDTDGSLLSCSVAALVDLHVAIYRGGKLESAHVGRDCAALEIVNREKNPYVSSLG